MAEGQVDDVDSLYEIEPGGFVAARDELVRRLKKEGRKDDAASVAKLRRPTPVAWALNQVARGEPELITAALDAGARLREASDAAVAGDASSLRQATADDRAASDAVLAAAGRHLGDKAPAARQALASTLRAAVLDEAVADELRRGVLTTDHEDAGFGFGLGAGAVADVIPLRPRTKKAAAKPTKAADDAAARERREAERAERAEEEVRAREERKRRAELEAAAKRLRQRADRLADAADRAEEAARLARQEADAAAEEAAAAAAALP